YPPSLASANASSQPVANRTTPRHPAQSTTTAFSTGRGGESSTGADNRLISQHGEETGRQLSPKIVPARDCAFCLSDDVGLAQPVAHDAEITFEKIVDPLRRLGGRRLRVELDSPRVVADPVGL